MKRTYWEVLQDDGGWMRLLGKNPGKGGGLDFGSLHLGRRGGAAGAG